MRNLFRRFVPVIIVGTLPACSFEMPDLGFLSDNDTLPGKAPLAQLPPGPKPLYQPGDTYIFNDDGNVVQEQVVGVTPDRVTWTNDSGLIWTTTNEIVTPQLSWSSHPELGRGRQNIIGNPGTLFPLQEGNISAFGIRGSSEKVPTGWEDEVRCAVSGQEDVTVPAGTFTTYRIDCSRKNVETSLYYAPVAQNYVLRERTFANSRSRKELMSVSLADNRTAEMPVTVDQPEKMSDMVAPSENNRVDTAKSDSVIKVREASPAMRNEADGRRLLTMISRLEAVIGKLEALEGNTMDQASGPAIRSAAKPEKRNNQKAVDAAISQDGKYGIHLASYRTMKGARRGWAALEKQYPNELKILSFKTVEFDAGDGRGTFVRLVGAAFKTRADALRACSAMKAKRQFCQAVRIAR